MGSPKCKPSEYFANSLGDALVNALARCALTMPNNPIDFLSDEIEMSFIKRFRHGKEKTNEDKATVKASVYFKSTFGNSLKQALFEAILLRPENPIAEIADKLENNYIDANFLQPQRTKLSRFYRQTAPIITDIRALTSTGLG